MPDDDRPTDSAGVVARGVHRSFGTVRALAGADLVARPGRVTGLVGPNGSGKTTLLLVLAGLLVPDAGQVRVDGLDPVTDGIAARARTGWMPDVFGTWDSLTAREILHAFADAYRVPADTARARVDGLLDTVHLADLADRPASVLSRGQKQRLGLARALVHAPDVLLLDEPAGGLDPRSRVELRALLRGLAADGATVVVSSHVLTELEEMADDVVFLSAGRTVTAPTDGPAGAPWRLRALSLAALTSWLTAAGVAWQPDAEVGAGATAATDGVEMPGSADTPGSVLVPVTDEQVAARLVHDAVLAGVPVTGVGPASGALERAYLALDEERR